MDGQSPRRMRMSGGNRPGRAAAADSRTGALALRSGAVAFSRACRTTQDESRPPDSPTPNDGAILRTGPCGS